jgi:hypothetical protein
MSLDDRDWYREEMRRRQRNVRFWRRVQRRRQVPLGLVVALMLASAAGGLVAAHMTTAHQVVSHLPRVVTP